jgi:hypothetical protein
MVERQLRWNYRTTDDFSEGARLLEYYVLIVNDKREIENIESKIYSQLQPIIDKVQDKSAPISGTNGLMYTYIQFKSMRSDFKPRNAYDGKKVIKDRNLYPRATLEQSELLDEYILKTIGAKIHP